MFLEESPIFILVVKRFNMRYSLLLGILLLGWSCHKADTSPPSMM